MTIEEMEQKLYLLEKENKELKEKLTKRKSREKIKTTKKEIIDYWAVRQDECELSVDWAEAHERCWRCGYKKTLDRCHIIPDSLGGKDEPKNLVLLCRRCHKEAPNVEDEEIMWDWIRAYKTSFYDTFWKNQERKEYEFIYKKSFLDELKERDILSYRDLDRFWNINIGRSSIHYGQPWGNTATDVGILRMRLKAYDAQIGCKHNKKTKQFREKEKKFDKLVWEMYNFARKTNFSIWEGRSKNPFSITISHSEGPKQKCYVSVKLGRDNKYKIAYTNEANPNNSKVSDYNILVGESEEDVLKLVKKEVNSYIKKFGKPKQQEYVFTYNPIYHLREE